MFDLLGISTPNSSGFLNLLKSFWEFNGNFHLFLGAGEEFIWNVTEKVFGMKIKLIKLKMTGFVLTPALVMGDYSLKNQILV